MSHYCGDGAAKGDTPGRFWPAPRRAEREGDVAILTPSPPGRKADGRRSGR